MLHFTVHATSANSPISMTYPKQLMLDDRLPPNKCMTLA
jgi:hypothetical protein